MRKFKKGDVVSWSVPSTSPKKTMIHHEGVVIAIVPPNTHWLETEVMNSIPGVSQYRFPKVPTGSRPELSPTRDHESYLVVEPNRKVFWPIVSKLVFMANGGKSAIDKTETIPKKLTPIMETSDFVRHMVIEVVMYGREMAEGGYDTYVKEFLERMQEVGAAELTTDEIIREDLDTAMAYVGARKVKRLD